MPTHLMKMMLASLAMLALLCGPARAQDSAKDMEAVMLQAGDGYNVAAWYWKPRQTGSPAAILLHMRGSNKAAWGELPAKLIDEGYAVVAIDLRGHGESTFPNGTNPGYRALEDSDYLAMLNDVKAAHDFLDSRSEVDAERVAIIGASIGANLAIMYASADRRVRTVVALSAGQDYRGLQPGPYLDRYGRRPLYLLCAKGDDYSWQSSKALEKLATKADPVSLRVFPGKAHGTDLLDSQEGLADTIVSGWLLNYLAPKR